MAWMVWIVLLSGCFPAKAPLQTAFSEGPQRDTLLVLLPGFGAHDRSFFDKGMVEALRAGGVDTHVLSVDATFGYYMSGQLEERLRADVVPLARKYDHVWVLGISMGGVGTLLTAQAFPDLVDGVVLLSPYIGRGKTLKAVQAAPSVAAYDPGPDPDWDEELWTWLRQLDGSPEALPPIYLGHGDKDLGMKDHLWFASLLPSERVHVVPGGHNWKTWRVLGERIARQDLVDLEAFDATEARSE